MLSEIEGFVNWTRRRNPETRTWRDYGYDLYQFARSMNDVEPGKVRFSDVDRFVCEQLNRGYKATTINRRLGAILSFYLFLADTDSALVCPVRMHRHHLREPQHLPRPAGRYPRAHSREPAQLAARRGGVSIVQGAGQGHPAAALDGRTVYIARRLRSHPAGLVCLPGRAPVSRDQPKVIELRARCIEAARTPG